MEIWLASTGFLGLIMLLMAIGVIVKGRPLKGSCGGLNELSRQESMAFCEICGADGTDKKPYCD